LRADLTEPLYVGVTLVYFEFHDDRYGAIQREKRIKKWNREWKIELIERRNPDWKDLSEEAG
jgi:putative endonuclease